MQDGGYEKCNGFSEKCKMADMKHRMAFLKNARWPIWKCQMADLKNVKWLIWKMQDRRSENTRWRIGKMQNVESKNRKMVGLKNARWRIGIMQAGGIENAISRRIWKYKKANLKMQKEENRFYFKFQQCFTADTKFYPCYTTLVLIVKQLHEILDPYYVCPAGNKRAKISFDKRGQA